MLQSQSSVSGINEAVPEPESDLLLWHKNSLAFLNKCTSVPSGLELYLANDTIIKLGVFAGVTENKTFGVTLTVLMRGGFTDVNNSHVKNK